MARYGIYGYECTEVVTGTNFTITPIYPNLSKVYRLASDRTCYNLTAFVDFNDDIEDISRALQCLEGVLSFIDQRDVLICNPISIYCDYEDIYPQKVYLHKRHNGAGKQLPSDGNYVGLRSRVIELLYVKLTDKAAIDYMAYGTAFFKSIEVFRGRACFLDINYYLLFSSLESLARFSCGRDKPTEQVITKFLNELGFRVEQNISNKNINKLENVIECYVSLRNPLFHNGEFSILKNCCGGTREIEFKLSHFYQYLKALMPIILLKYVGFEHESFDINRWISNERRMV